MKPLHTGIAVALAVIVIAVFFVVPGLNPFAATSASAPQQQAAVTNANQTSPSMPDATNTQLSVTDDTLGTGAAAEPGDTITVSYVGTLPDGTVFDASANHPDANGGFTFQLGEQQVIPGWDEGLVGMKVGGTRTLVVPPSLGYGSQDYGPIPGNSTLTFQVQLLKVASPSGQ